MGILITLKLEEGLIKAVPQLISKIPQIAMSLVNGFVNMGSHFKDIGLNILKGILNGFTSIGNFV